MSRCITFFKLILPLGTLLLASCAHQPREVDSTINLVAAPSISTKFEAKNVPFQPTIGNSIEIKSKRFVVGRQYTSALGEKCHRLVLQLHDKVNKINSISPVVCNIGGQWTVFTPKTAEKSL